MFRGIGTAVVGSLLIIVILALVTGLCVADIDVLKPSVAYWRRAQAFIYLTENLLRIQHEALEFQEDVRLRRELHDLALRLAPTLALVLSVAILSVAAGLTYWLISLGQSARIAATRAGELEEWRSIARRLAQANEQIQRLKTAG